MAWIHFENMALANPKPRLVPKARFQHVELRRCHLVALLFCWSCVQKVLQHVCFGLDCLRVMQLWSFGCHFLGY